MMLSTITLVAMCYCNDFDLRLKQKPLLVQYLIQIWLLLWLGINVSSTWMVPQYSSQISFVYHWLINPSHWKEIKLQLIIPLMRLCWLFKPYLPFFHWTFIGRLRGLAVACLTTDYYHLCLNLGVGISEGCFIPFSLPCAWKWP